MQITNNQNLKTKTIAVLSFLFLILNASIPFAQGTYAQRIKIKGTEYAAGLISTIDGGNALLFNIDKSVLLRTVSASGEKIWQRELHEQEASAFGFQGAGVTQLSDGSFITSGAGRYSPFSSDPWLVKLNHNGEVDWQKHFTEGNSVGSIFFSVISSPDGGFFAAGKRYPVGFPFPLPFGSQTKPYAAEEHGIIVAGFDSDGGMRWGRIFNSSFLNRYFDAFRLLITKENKLIVVSQATSTKTGKYSGAVVLKLDTNGNLIWKKVLKKNNLLLTSAIATADNGCFLLFSTGKGINDYKVFTVKLGSKGEILWKRSFRILSQPTEGFAATESTDRSLILTGAVYFPVGGQYYETKIFLAKLNSAGVVISSAISNSKDIGYPRFIEPQSDSGYVVLGESTNSFLFKLGSEANLAACNSFGPATIKHQNFSKLKIVNPKIAVGTWNPLVGTSNIISSSELKVTTAQFCP